jgi:hypothetical protein
MTRHSTLSAPGMWPAGATRVLLYTGIPAVVALLLWAVVVMDMVVYLLALVVALVLAWAIWCFPFPAAVALVVIAPINRFLLMMLYAGSNSVLLLRAGQLWKDLLILVLVGRLIHEAFARRRSPRLYLLDLLVGGFIALCVLYTAYPGTEGDLALTTRLIALRFDAFFLLAYFVGRGLNLTRSRLRFLLLAAVPVCLVTAMVAYWQWLRPEQAARLFERLGYTEFRMVIGATDPDLIRERLVAGTTIPRAASLAMGDLALAFYCVFIIPVAGAIFFSVKGGWRQFAAGAFVLAMIVTLLATNNRSGAIASAGILVLLALWTRSFVRLGVVLLTLTAIALAYVLRSGISADVIRLLLSFQEDSAAAHVDVIQNSLRLIRESPLGQGLGTAGPISVRQQAGGAFVTESWYFQVALEVGIAGAILFILVLLVAIVNSQLSSLYVRDLWLRVVTLGAGGALIGYALVGAWLHVWEVTPVSMVVWLFAGIAVRAPALEREWRAPPDATP